MKFKIVLLLVAAIAVLGYAAYIIWVALSLQEQKESKSQVDGHQKSPTTTVDGHPETVVQIQQVKPL